MKFKLMDTKYVEDKYYPRLVSSNPKDIRKNVLDITSVQN